MKNMKYYLQFIVLAFCLSLAACSDDDDNKTTPVFPELQKIEGTVGETLTVRFDAPVAWRLTSSALWCKFVVDGEELNSCSGEAGEQAVTVVVLDEATALLKAYKSEISLWMNGYNEVICEVTRPTTGYELVLLDKDGNPYTDENPATVAYGRNSTNFKVKANFDWRLTGWPEWLECTEVADIAGVSKSTISPRNITAGYVKSPISGEFVFINEAGDEVVRVPVKYDGIPADKIEFSLSTAYGYEFSAKGDTYSGGSSMGGGSTYEAPMKFTVVAKDDAYEIVYLKRDNWGYSQMMAMRWFQVADNNQGEISLSVEENTGDEDRRGALMIFPKHVYDEIEDFDKAVFDQSDPDFWDIKRAYEDYIAVDFTQKANSGSSALFSMTGMNGMTGQSVELTYLLDAGYSESQLMGEHMTTNVYQLILPTDQSLSTLIISLTGLPEEGTYYIPPTWSSFGVASESMGNLGFILSGLENVAPTSAWQKKLTIYFNLGEETVGALIIQYP